MSRYTSGMNRKARRAAAQKEDKQAAVRAIVQARVEARKRAVVAKKSRVVGAASWLAGRVAPHLV